MAKTNALDMLYNKTKSPLEFNFDNLWAPPLLSLLTVQDIAELNRIATSVKLTGKIETKYKLIDQIMTNRGFVKLHAGTNRVVYRFIEDQRFVVKIAIDRVGIGDNPAEYRNQFLLKPFVTKVFEVSPCGTVGLFERVDAIMSREEFISVADDIFTLITKFFVGKYILEDFGSHYFMNWGIRKDGFGLVLLDFPYVYELDGNKLYCNAPEIGNRNIVCGGQLDYDDGFNNLICTKCGKLYHARDLKKSDKEKLIIVGGKKKMKVKVKIGSTVIKSNTQEIVKVIEQPEQSCNAIEQYNNDKVESRTDKVIECKVEIKKPKDSIFKKEEKKKEKSTNEDKPDDNKDVVDLDMTSQLNLALQNETYDDDYEEDDYDEYDQYLSNRQRSSKKNNAKMKSKKGNTDFSGF